MFAAPSIVSATFTCYPTPLLGTNYCVMSRGSGNVGNSEFAIVATEDDTTVWITPSAAADLAGNPGTNTYSMTLQAGETYQDTSEYVDEEVTGTTITSDKPIGVFAGVDEAYVPDSTIRFGNPLVQEQLPVESWGNQALAMSFAGRMIGDSYRALAVNNNTVIFTNGVVAGTNQAGQWLDFIIDGPIMFQASQPIQVAHFGNGYQFDNPPFDYGDPCEILLPPTGHYLITNTVITLPNDNLTGDFPENYLNLIVAQSAITNTLVDGSHIATTNFVAIGTSGYYAAQFTVTNSGTHTMTSSQPVGVEVYGWGEADAYGYFGGIVK